MLQVTKNLYVETGMTACNLGFVTTKAGVVMIDTPMKPTDAVKWRNEAVSKGEIRYLINTEEHPDHWQTSHFFPGVLITSKATRDKLAEVPLARVLDTVKNMDPAAAPLMEGYRVRLADIAITDNTDLYVGDHTIKLFRLPGHSDGGIGVYIPEERAVFTTDIVFQKKKSWLHESQPEQWIASLKKLGELDVEVVVPGHGELCKKDYLKEQSGIVEQWIEAVKSAIKKGWSVEEAGERISSPDPYPKQPNTPMTEPELNRAIVARLYHLYS
ncbi:MAG TPA: MBL fold metallo-hydrolase [Syntrophorhabdales bacterium]|nr:MBL fold metallo-hydrolase [Syntrophorhabdales bacterium]